MNVQRPEDWPGTFTQYLNAGELEDVVSLYDPQARFVESSGEVIVGREQIGAVLAGLIESKARLRSRVVQCVVSDDLALLYTDFDGTTTDAAGREAPMRAKAVELLRRQADGAWRLIVGDPSGRE